MESSEALTVLPGGPTCPGLPMNPGSPGFPGNPEININTSEYQLINIYCITLLGEKGRYSSFWEPHLRATGRHLPYGITQCYLPPDTSERTPPS